MAPFFVLPVNEPTQKLVVRKSCLISIARDSPPDPLWRTTVPVLAAGYVLAKERLDSLAYFQTIE
jgi:hypothetical protein